MEAKEHMTPDTGPNRTTELQTGLTEFDKEDKDNAVWNRILAEFISRTQRAEQQSSGTESSNTEAASNRTIADASDDTSGQQQTQNTAGHKGMATRYEEKENKEQVSKK